MALPFLPPAGDIVFLTALRPGRTLEGMATIPGAPKITGQLYGRLRRVRSLNAKAVVFCDVERLGPEQEDLLAALARAWAPQVPVLNSPPDALRRYPLMKALQTAGINRTGLCRLDDEAGLAQIRFPCFVRYENGHLDKGAPPALLMDRAALDAHLAQMRANGETFYGKIAIEYEDVRDEAGRHVKYSYFRIGDDLIPGHRFVNHHWFVKAASPALIEAHPELIEAERAYIEAGPYRAEIARVFNLAGVQYGRVDFGVRRDGGLHVFEINTNPRHPLLKETHAARIPLLEAVKEKLARACAALVKGRQSLSLHWQAGDF